MMPTPQASQVQFQLSTSLIHKIQTLPPERIAQVDDFVEFLWLQTQHNQEHAQDRALTRAISQASESSFASAWDNAEDEVYDAL